MIKTLALLIAGAMVGGVLVRAVIGAAGAPVQSTRSLLQGVATAASGGARAGDAISVAETLEIYRAAAAVDDVAALRAELQRAARAPASAARTAEIDATLARLSDLAPAEAASLARSLGLASMLIADAYSSLARVDPERAIEELGLIEGRSNRGEVALALLDVLGGAFGAIDRVSAGLPESERSSLQLEWIAARAEYEPLAAIRDAGSLAREAERREALERIGRAWAARDPRGALTQAAQLPNDLQMSFRTGVFDEWARLDAADFLAWLSATTSPPREYLAAARLIASVEPELVLSVTDDMLEPARRIMNANALEALAERDANAAMARVTAMPTGAERESILATVVSSIARRDPDAALERAQELGAPSQDLMMRVVRSIAENHPERAIELMDHPPDGFESSELGSVVTSVLAMSGEPAYSESLADKLIVNESLQAAGALRNLVGNWIRSEPNRALEWIVANEARLDRAVIGQAARAMAADDPEEAARYVDLVPADHRAVWIDQVAAYYGAADMSAALSWVDRFRSHEMYPRALRQIVSAAAQTDPRAAAQVLAQSSPEVMLGVAAQVAQAYASVDPHAAIRWAGTLSDAAAREEAAGAAISSWADTDRSAAWDYTMKLERGEERDHALSALLPRMSVSGEVDRSFFEAYSGETARQGALATAIPLIARDDPRHAEELLDLLTSESARTQLEQRLRALIQ